MFWNIRICTNGIALVYQNLGVHGMDLPRSMILPLFTWGVVNYQGMGFYSNPIQKNCNKEEIIGKGVIESNYSNLDVVGKILETNYKNKGW